MKPLRRVHKTLLYSAAGLVILMVLVLGAARLYLSSRFIAGRIAERMQEVLGGSVSIQSADISLAGGSTLEGLRAYEGDVRETPWLEIGRIDADVSAFGFLGGNRPRDVGLRDAAVTLRFSKDNRLLTHLPAARKTAEAVPDVRIEHSRFTLIQEGRDRPLEATGVTGTLAGDGTSVKIQGNIDDPYWGKWSITALLEPQTKRVTLQMDAEPSHLTMEKLRSLPFIPKAVWEEVKIEGDSPVFFTLTFKPASEPGGKPNVHYRIDLEPKNTTVFIPSISLHADHASGKVRIEDKVVYLTDVKGRSADGEVQVPEATLDFRPPVGSDLDFKIKVDGVALHGLPKTWKGLEKRFPGMDGLVTGHVDLQVAVRKGKATPSGSGQFDIRNLHKGRIPLGRLSMKFRLDEKGFHLGMAPGRTDTPVAAMPALWAVALLAPARPPDPPASDLLSWTTHIPNALVHGVGLLTQKAVDATFSGLSRLTGTGKTAPKAPAPTKYADVDFSLEDVNLANLVTALKVQLPFSLEGTLAIQAHIGFPIDTPGELKAYRVRGSATMPRLVLAGLEMTDVRAAVRFEEGILDLTELKGKFPAPRPALPTGSFSGTARLEVRPAGNLRADLEVEDLPLDRILRLLPGTTSGAAGMVSGKVSGHVLADRLRELAAWDGKADLRLQAVDAQALGKAVPAVPVRLEGQVSGTIHGLLTPAAPTKPPALSAQIELTAPQLKVQGIPTQKVSGSIDFQPGGTPKYRLEGESLGGRFKLEGKLPPRSATPPEPPPPVRPAAFRQAPPTGPDGHLQVEGVRLSRLWEVYHLQDLLGPLHGVISLDLPFRHVGPDRLPVGEGKFRLADLRWAGEDLSVLIQGDVRLRAEGLEFRDVTGSLGRGILRANFLAPLGERALGWFNVSLSGVDAGHLLLPWPALGRNIQGPVDASLRGRLGAEWTGGGTVVLGRGRVFGIEVNEWRLPVQFAVSVRQGTGEVSVRDSSAAIATGRAVGQAEFSFGAGARADGHLRFYDVDLRALASSAGDVSSFASGRLSGGFDFGGTEVSSADDLSGTLTATLSQSQALQLPVLRQLTPYLRLGMSSSTFQTGRLEARLGRGAFRIQHFSLDGGLLQMLIEGSVTLEGRLDLDVHARTGNATLVPAGLRLLGVRLPIAGPIPASVITEASFLLAQTVVHLRVTGTIRSPVVQVEPLSLLTQEAVRYFLSRAILPNP
jgi:hypothetical protein